jgi:WD40 repeat protein
LGDRIVATGSLNGAGVLRLWDARSGAELRQENVPNSAAIAWCASNKKIFFGRSQIKSWDLQSFTLSSVVGSDRAGLSIRVSPNSRYLAAGGHSRIVHIWDVQDLAGGATRWGWHQGSIESLSWSPNGSQLASVSSDSTLRLWNSATGEPQWLALLLPDESVAVFSPGGKLLHGNAESLEEHVIYLVGHPDGRTDILRPSAFEERLDRIKASDN